MFRSVLLALFCLIAVGALLVLKTNAGAPTNRGALLVDATVGATSDQVPLLKADRLDLAPENAPNKIAVSTIKITPTEPKAEKPSGKTAEITNWHWHEGSKLIKRTR
jgi:hypothetical protein